MLDSPARSLFAGLAALATLAATAPMALAQQPVSYHGVSSATHQAQTTTLGSQGYRITSLSVAGSLSAPVYSAVWEQVAGPAQLASHDMSVNQYLAFRTSCINQGYRAKIITAAGTTSASQVFAAVFVNDGVTVVDGISFTPSLFADWPPSNNSDCQIQRAAGRILVSADLRGDASYGPYVCAVFEPNPGNLAWGCNIDASSAEFSETRTAHGDAGSRLACLGMSESQSYISAWYDDRVGNQTVAVNQTGTAWQNIYNAITATQYHRIIASGGSSLSLRFGGSFAQYRTPLIRTNSTTGTARLQFAALDTDMRAMLVASGGRSAALAIAKEGKLVYARGYTRGEPGYPVTQPDDVFRLASLSKVMNAVATHEAGELGLLQMTERPEAVLGLSATVPNFSIIQIRHILEYVSGIRRNYSATEIAGYLGVSLPISLTAGTDWLDEQPTLYLPSSYTSYSNAAWMLTAECIRVRSGLSYMSFLQNRVFTPLGITRAKVAASSLQQLAANDVFPQTAALVTVPTELNSTGTRVSEQFYEDLNFKRTSGGLACSAIDYVRLLSGVFDLQGADAIVLDDATRDYALEPHTFPKYGTTTTDNVCRAGMGWHDRAGNVRAYTKDGVLGSADTYACWRTDGWSFAVFANIGGAALPVSAIQSHLDGMTSWPNVDEFPNYGMPSFPQRARIEGLAPASLDNVTSGFFQVAGKRMDTVTRVDFGSIQITSQQPGTWADGWFDVLSPTILRIYPPQGRMATTYGVRLVNAAGFSNIHNVSLTLGAPFRLGAPTTVGNQPWACVVGRGTTSGLPINTSFALLCLSFSNAPSLAPGLVNLGLGNQFSELLTTGVQQLSVLTSATRFDLPVLPSGTIYVEAVGFDITQPSIFPLLTTSTLAVTRQ